jgi:hypothetical protein
MPYFLPVPPPPDDWADSTAAAWERAEGGPGPSTDETVEGPTLPSGGAVTYYRTGPGDTGDADQWMGEDFFVVPRQGVQRGRELFDLNQWQPPNEGHGEYEFAQDGPWLDHSMRNLALFWSDWAASTALQAGGRGSFTGPHVVIARVPPGSTQGYMPTGAPQLNNERSMPGPWDAQLAAGRESYLASMRASTSQPPQGV